MDDYMTIDELAVILKCHPMTLRRLARLGKLPGAFKLGHRWLVHWNTFKKETNNETRP